jgi:hypothetical protein
MLNKKGYEMSIEELMLDTGKSLENTMTEFETKCYGMSEQAIRDQYMNSITAKMSGMEMVVMGILSDCQELSSWSNSNESVRQQLNIAKFILCEMMDEKRSNNVTEIA